MEAIFGLSFPLYLPIVSGQSYKHAGLIDEQRIGSHD